MTLVLSALLTGLSGVTVILLCNIMRSGRVFFWVIVREIFSLDSVLLRMWTDAALLKMKDSCMHNVTKLSQLGLYTSAPPKRLIYHGWPYWGSLGSRAQYYFESPLTILYF